MAQNLPPSEASGKSAAMRFKKGVWYTIEIPSIADEILDVEEAMIEALSQTSFSDADVFAVRLALDEALANAIKHGNDGDPEKTVTIRFCFGDATITITVRDEGPGFDYSEIPDCTQPDRLEIPSGRGLLIMKSYMDRVIFNETGNEVTMVKGLGDQ